ncbi:MAG: PEP-CTERM system TPR-repeat protein PrsT [Gammaproteobacteria bacterium]|nr:PEP-CTERM system TPR-repeat protein PrsT [Gammaproteobacteria bacterium]
MNIKNTLSIKLLFLIVLLLSACDENKPQVSANDHLDLARLYFNKGAFKASVIEARNALQIEPDNIETLTTMTKTLIKLNDYASAKKTILRAISLDKGNEDLKTMLAKNQLLENDIASARKTIDAINTSSIQNIANYNNTKADILFALKDFTEAKKWYNKSLKLDKKNVISLIGAAKSSTLLKQAEEADKLTQQAVTYNPNNIDALIWQAQVYIYKKQYRDAEASLSKAMVELEQYDTLTSDKYIAIELLSKVLLAQGKIEESFRFSNYLSQSRPGKLQAAYKKAFSLISNKDNILEAEKAFEDVLRQAPSHTPSGVMLGIINFNKGDYSQADEYLSKFANEHNSALRSKKLLILTKIKLNNADAAIQIASESLKTHGNDADLHALSGYAYFINKNLKQSIIALNTAIGLSDNNAIYYSNISSVYLKDKDIKNAQKYAKIALKLKPDSVQAKLVLIETYLANNQIKQAKTMATNWIKKTPGNVLALNTSASISLKSNNHSDAKKLFLKALSIDPLNLNANTALVQFDINENNTDKAYERLYLVLNQHPEHNASLSMLFELAKKTNSFHKMEKILSLVITKNPTTINTRLVLAQYYLLTKSADKTLQIFDQITKLDPRNSKAYILKAKALHLQNNKQQAIDTYLLLASILPDNAIGFTELGKYYLQNNNSGLATEHAKKALLINNTYLDAHILLVKSAIQNSNKPLAMQSITFVKDQLPDSPLADIMETELHLKLNDTESALKALDRAWKIKKSIQLAEKYKTIFLINKQDKLAFRAWHELSKENPSNLKVQVAYAASLHQSEQYNLAKQVLEAQLRLSPDNAVLLNNMAEIYLQTNDQRALETAKRAHDLAPHSPAVKDTLGWIYLQQHKDTTKAIPLLQQAYNDSSSQDIKQHLIIALTQAGRTKEADSLK